MTKQNKKSGIKKLMNTRRSIKIKKQIQHGFDIAKKWTRENKEAQQEEIMHMKNMAEALRLLKQQKEQQKEE